MGISFGVDVTVDLLVGTEVEEEEDNVAGLRIITGRLKGRIWGTRVWIRWIDRCGCIGGRGSAVFLSFLLYSVREKKTRGGEGEKA